MVEQIIKMTDQEAQKGNRLTLHEIDHFRNKALPAYLWKQDIETLKQYFYKTTGKQPLLTQKKTR